MLFKLDAMASLAIISALSVATLRLGHFFELAGLSAFTGWATAATLTGGQVYAASRLAAGTSSPWILRTSWVLSILSVSWLGAADVVVGLSGDVPAAVLSATYLETNPVLWLTGLLAVLPLEIMAAAGGRGLADSDRVAEERARADDELLDIARQRNEAEKREERILRLLEASNAPPPVEATVPTGTLTPPPDPAADTSIASDLEPWHCADCGTTGSKPLPPNLRQRGYAGHRKSCPARSKENAGS